MSRFIDKGVERQKWAGTFEKADEFFYRSCRRCCDNDAEMSMSCNNCPIQEAYERQTNLLQFCETRMIDYDWERWLDDEQ